jgi:hypothetical protein
MADRVVEGTPMLLVEVDGLPELVCTEVATVIVDCAVMVREVDVGPGAITDTGVS